MERAGDLLIDDDGTFRVHFDRFLRHDAARVWAALVDPERLAIWMEGCRIDARVGGRVLFDFGDEGAATGEVLAVRAPGDDVAGELVHTWLWDGLSASRVVWTVTPMVGGTRLQLTHAELASTDGVVDFACGWHVIADTLGRYLDGIPFDDVWDGYEEILAVYTSQIEAGAARSDA